MVRRIAMGAGVVALFGAMTLVGWLTAATADDTPGCEGLGEYREEMLTIGEDFWDARTEAGLDDTDELMTWTPDDWTTFAELETDYARLLRDIEPPAFAADWHDVHIDSAGLLINVSKAVVDGGVLMIAGFTGEIDKLDAREGEAYNAAVTSCPDFAGFFADWDAIDGEIEGPPSATPIATPEPA